MSQTVEQVTYVHLLMSYVKVDYPRFDRSRANPSGAWQYIPSGQKETEYYILLSKSSREWDNSA